MKKIIPIIIVLLIIGGGIYLFLSSGKISLAPGGASITQQMFTGSLKLAVEKGIPLKCSYKVDDNNFGSGYIKGKKYAADVSIQGKKGRVIMIDNCLWSWNEGQTQGAKMCFEPTDGKDIWDQQDAGNRQFNCSPTLVGDEAFAIPSNVSFIDIDKAGGIQE